MANNIAVTLPSPYVLSAFMGSDPSVTLPALTATATGSSSTNGVSITLPMLTAVAQGGANADGALPMGTLAITGTFTNAGQIDATMPMATVSAAGKTTALGSVTAKLPTPYALVGYSGAVLSATIGGYTLTATGKAGGVATVTAELPLYQLSAAGTAQNSGDVNALMPMGRMVPSAVAYAVMPMGHLTAIGTAVVAVTYEAYALNLNHTPRRDNQQPADELTHYTNYPFDMIVRYKNSYFGMNSTGLYLLEGTTDYDPVLPTEPAWAYRTSMMDFGSIQMKNVSMAYFGGRMAPAATVTVYAGETTPTPYSYTTPRDETAQNYRQPLGLGLKARYYAFGAAGVGELTLDSLSIDVSVLTRKV